MSESGNPGSRPAGMLSSIHACQPALSSILNGCAQDRDPAHAKAERPGGLIFPGCAAAGVLGIGATGTPAAGGFSHA